MRGPGLPLVFGIVMSPVYLMLLGWFLERPRSLRLALIGTGYLLGVTLAVWAAAAVLAALIGLVFF